MSEENLFLALMLDPALHESVARRLERSVSVHGFTGRPRGTERLHVSLLGFGSYEERQAKRVRTIADAFCFPSFEIRFDTVMSFRNSGPHPFVLTGQQGVKGVRALYLALHDWFYGDDLEPKKPRSFTPHMTLLYDEKLVLPYTLMSPLSWMVREFVLVRSYVGHSRYDILGRWQLVEEN